MYPGQVLRISGASEHLPIDVDASIIRFETSRNTVFAQLVQAVEVEGKSYRYLTATPRYKGCKISGLFSGKRLVCGVTLHQENQEPENLLSSSDFAAFVAILRILVYDKRKVLQAARASNDLHQKYVLLTLLARQYATPWMIIAAVVCSTAVVSYWICYALSISPLWGVVFFWGILGGVLLFKVLAQAIKSSW